MTMLVAESLLLINAAIDLGEDGTDISNAANDLSGRPRTAPPREAWEGVRYFTAASIGFVAVGGIGLGGGFG